jgi:hypothetical protein
MKRIAKKSLEIYIAAVVIINKLINMQELFFLYHAIMKNTDKKIRIIRPCFVHFVLFMLYLYLRILYFNF